MLPRLEDPAMTDLPARRPAAPAADAAGGEPGRWGDIRRNPRTGQVAVHVLSVPGARSRPWVALAPGYYDRQDAACLGREDELHRTRTTLSDAAVAGWRHEGNLGDLLARGPLPRDLDRMDRIDAAMAGLPVEHLTQPQPGDLDGLARAVRTAGALPPPS